MSHTIKEHLVEDYESKNPCGLLIKQSEPNPVKESKNMTENNLMESTRSYMAQQEGTSRPGILEVRKGTVLILGDNTISDNNEMRFGKNGIATVGSCFGSTI